MGNDNPAGIDVELAKEAFHRMGYKPVFVNIDWEWSYVKIAAGIKYL